MAARIKKGDTVVVLAGKDKGKRGQVSEVLTKLDKVIVEGVNSVIIHKKQDKDSAAEECRRTLQYIYQMLP